MSEELVAGLEQLLERGANADAPFDVRRWVYVACEQCDEATVLSDQVAGTDRLLCRRCNRQHALLALN
jgi:formylmethanofuran dehydrogenase subunit E